ncbi:MAG: NAD(P)H-hydrate dehydratase [Proteobacteria bacterium]|nr:NAD(P)H-hydrate dehydratase [Pseudomonadota bacterium]
MNPTDDTPESIFPPGSVLLSVAQMYRSDEAAIDAGVAGIELMENAGSAVASAIQARWQPCPVSILCGPGNNGGDGFVVARLLRDAGWPVRVALLGDRAGLKGDAKTNSDRWGDAVEPLAPAAIDGAGLVVDALFGAGLARDIDGVAKQTLEAVGKGPLVAVDVPSGVHGDTGAINGYAAQADLTVTFFRRKPGHLLLPGRALCGEVVVADIGTPPAVLAGIAPLQAANSPALWRARFPWPKLADHKYRRGHAVITGGRNMTGAARLAAKAAQRAGAGMVTVAVPNDATVVYRIALTSALVHPFLDTHGFGEYIKEPRVSAILVGPGNELNLGTRERALLALRTGKEVVLDADALSIFEGSTELLFDTISGPCVLTPHDGEFARLFDTAGDKLSRVRRAAERSGAVVLLKGADTVIAAPDGRAVINENAPPDLATGGAGDVLAGLVTGLLAQRMDAFDAACAAVWLHGEAAVAFGPGLVADDLIDSLPAVLRRLKQEESSHE